MNTTCYESYIDISEENNLTGSNYTYELSEEFKRTI